MILYWTYQYLKKKLKHQTFLNLKIYFNDLLNLSKFIVKFWQNLKINQELESPNSGVPLWYPNMKNDLECLESFLKRFLLSKERFGAKINILLLT